jgi:hypothetical protein
MASALPSPATILSDIQILPADAPLCQSLARGQWRASRLTIPAAQCAILHFPNRGARAFVLANALEAMN